MLAEQPVLAPPTTTVRESWLAAERAERDADGGSTAILFQAAQDFSRFVAARQGVLRMWNVPTTILWYAAGRDYLGELVIRHRLTPALVESGGHVGYSIAPGWRGRGHGTRQLAAGLLACRGIGLTRVLLTCDHANEPSRRVILANGGRLDDRRGAEDRFWIDVPQS